MSQGHVLAIAGDPGGSRAIIPVLRYLEEKQFPFSIMNHGTLAKECPTSWSRKDVPESTSALQEMIRQSQAEILLFGTNVKDTLPLKMARIAKQEGMTVICLLDNWMNYRQRLEIDGLDLFLPDQYLVMDERARKEAIKEGIPKEYLKIVGQPALANLHEKYKLFSSNPEKSKTLKKIVFISEPVSQDQGENEQSLNFRGYTEKTVLKQFIETLESLTDPIRLSVVPHPRENIETLEKIIGNAPAHLSAVVHPAGSYSEQIFFADGVAGMASLILYESWLLGKPVLSLQPHLTNQQLNFLEDREGAYTVTKPSKWDSILHFWYLQCGKISPPLELRSEYQNHQNAPQVAGDIIISQFHEKSKV
jgi:hypothetical protein